MRTFICAGILLRNPEQSGPRVSAREGRVRRRHRRAGHAVGGELQGLHSNHAAAAGQPHAVDLRHAGRRRVRSVASQHRLPCLSSSRIYLSAYSIVHRHYE